ncbi:pyrroline-5-carboxylate reductase, NAD(P)-binding [Haemophilus influenzae]|uniref:Pyrroline-5-carboxylate reductase, NAD(P)-binding n=1 Tax=Haemophilus influenzae TaxID=727 RepID=A0A2X1Q0A7_HAEIF|nr:pyrroline-5-carboxylate reductase, NAD(P)-binding [Haemophilus influenzae]
MAQAIILGLLKQGYPAEQIIVNDPNEEKKAFFANLGVATSENNVESVIKAEVVLLAVKPQMMADVCLPLSAVDFSDKLLISIAAGISTERLNALIPSVKSIVRVMPNTPALVGEGMAVYLHRKIRVKITALLHKIYWEQWEERFGWMMKLKCTQSLPRQEVVQPISF